MTELTSVRWSAFVVPPLRNAAHQSVGLGRRAFTSLKGGATRLESGLERRMTRPGRPRTWGERGL